MKRSSASTTFDNDYNPGSSLRIPFLSDIEWNKETIYTILGSLFLAFILVITRGDFISGCILIVQFLILFMTIYRLDWGFFIFFAAVMSFDQFLPTGYLDGHFITKEIQYFDNLNTNKSN